MQSSDVRRGEGVKLNTLETTNNRKLTEGIDAFDCVAKTLDFKTAGVAIDSSTKD